MTFTTIFMLVVFAVIMVAGIAAGINMLSSSRVSNTTQETAQIVANVDGAFSNQSGFTGLSNTLAIAEKLVPANMVPSGSTTNIVNPYGGAVTLQADGTIANAFDVINGGLGNAACAAVAEQESAYEVEINNTVVASNGASVTPATASTDCAAGAGLNTVTVVNTQTSG